MVKWITTAIRGFVGLAVKPAPKWGQGVWGGRGAEAQTTPLIAEQVQWAPMPELQGPARPE